jgi:hypothetical protein
VIFVENKWVQKPVYIGGEREREREREKKHAQFLGTAVAWKDRALQRRRRLREDSCVQSVRSCVRATTTKIRLREDNDGRQKKLQELHP